MLHAFIDMTRLANEKWDMLLTCIHNGTIPDLDEVRGVIHLHQSQLRADPQRAGELQAISPPSSCSGWARRVWPNLSVFFTVCSGPFATALSKIGLQTQVRSIVGPNVAIVNTGYGSTECSIGRPFSGEEVGKYILITEDVVEFLEVTAAAARENIVQACDLEVGKLYGLVLTTGDGSWIFT
ncbi:GH3 auxin-responsive promoter [Phlebopus sp. FC_14]|nr:GH3 auxin-responsive promoter [Phlebopus sp. FC_14]